MNEMDCPDCGDELNDDYDTFDLPNFVIGIVYYYWCDVCGWSNEVRREVRTRTVEG